MNINELIPGFNRFKTVNLGLKRMLFVLGIPLVGTWSYFTVEGDRYYQGIPMIFFGLFAVLYWIIYWITIRIVFWVNDGFFDNRSGNKD